MGTPAMRLSYGERQRKGAVFALVERQIGGFLAGYFPVGGIGKPGDQREGGRSGFAVAQVNPGVNGRKFFRDLRVSHKNTSGCRFVFQDLVGDMETRLDRERSRAIKTVIEMEIELFLRLWAGNGIAGVVEADGERDFPRRFGEGGKVTHERKVAVGVFRDFAAVGIKRRAVHRPLEADDHHFAGGFRRKRQVLPIPANALPLLVVVLATDPGLKTSGMGKGNGFPSACAELTHLGAGCISEMKLPTVIEIRIHRVCRKQGCQ